MSIELQHVTHRFGPTPAVRDLSIHVPSGSLACLVGPSGCGKTTTLRLIAGLEPLEEGRILLDGKTVAEPERNLPPERRQVGLVFQDYALFPHLTVAENIRFGVARGDRQADERIAWLMQELEIAPLGPRYPHTLSGGEQQRAALARALAPAPRHVLLDEPFANLDRKLRLSVREQIVGLLRRLEATVLMVTHDPLEAMRISDRIILMSAGTLVQSGTPADLAHRPASKLSVDFFKEMNRLHAVVQADQTVATPWGRFAAPAHAPGTDVTVLIDPAAVRREADGPLRGFVCDARPVGSVGVVRIAEQQAHDGHMLMHASPYDLPASAETIALAVNPEGVYIFAQDEA